MLDIKALLKKMLQNQVVRTSVKAFTVPTLSAGARGYWTITLNDTIPTGARIVGVFHSSGSVSGLNGLQMTPINASGSSLYVEYHAPAAISGNTYTINFAVSYMVAS